jgi:hypothetical protein
MSRASNFCTTYRAVVWSRSNLRPISGKDLWVKTLARKMAKCRGPIKRWVRRRDRSSSSVTPKERQTARWIEMIVMCGGEGVGADDGDDGGGGAGEGGGVGAGGGAGDGVGGDGGVVEDGGAVEGAGESDGGVVGEGGGGGGRESRCSRAIRAYRA